MLDKHISHVLAENFVPDGDETNDVSYILNWKDNSLIHMTMGTEYEILMLGSFSISVVMSLRIESH